MIIPLVIAGAPEDLPEKIKAKIQYCDLTKFFLAGGWKSTTLQKLIKNVAEEIYTNYKVLQRYYTGDLTEYCNKFGLPDENEASLSWGKKSMIEAGFPGRDIS